MIQIYNNKHLTWDGTTSVNYYEFFADTVTDLPSDPYYFSSEKGRYKIAQGSIAWIIDVSEIYMFDSSGTWVLESVSGGGGGGGGTTNYNALTNKPSINSVELSGNKSLSDLGIQSAIDSSHKLSADLVTNGTTNKFNMQADWNQSDNTSGDYIKNKPTLGTAAATDATAYATAAQGTKADSAIQSVKVGGTVLTPDANKAVNITSIPSSVTAITQSQKDNSTKIATTAYVDKAVDDLPEPMVWTGTITITADVSDTTKCSIVVSKPSSASNIKTGFTYKIASIADTPVYTGTLKVGDTMIAAKDAPTVTSTWVESTDWNVVPSGDEPSGTVMSVTASNGLKTASGSAITSTGDIQADLASTTALSGNTIYNVGLNSSGNLAVKVPTVSKTAVGLTPQLPNESSTTKFLRQDGSWEIPTYTTVAEGSANGTVKVNGSDVSVHGLGTAAYTASTAYATSTQGGKADSAIQSVKRNGTALTPDANKAVDIGCINSLDSTPTTNDIATWDTATGLKDSGVSIETSFSSASDTKLPTSKSIATNVASNAVLTGYSVDTARSNITTSSTIRDAVEQLEYREELNKTNIMLNGALNPISVYSLDSKALTGASFIIPEDTAVKMPKGDYNISFTSNSAISGTLVVNNGSTETYRGTLSIVSGSNSFNFSVSSNSDKIRLYVSASCEITNLSIVPKSYRDSGYTDYIGATLPNTTLTPALTECVDNGKKNLLNVTTIATGNITFTPDDDGYVTASPNNTDTRGWTYASSQYKVYLKPATYVCVLDIKTASSQGGLGVSLRNTSDTAIFSSTLPDLQNKTGIVTFTFTITTEGSYGLIIKQYDMVARFMICEKALYDVSSSFQPFPLSTVSMRLVASNSTTNATKYQMNKKDFAQTSDVSNSIGTYIINTVTWNTSPSFSLYCVSYSGGNFSYYVVTKIAGADRTISVSNSGLITVEALPNGGKVSIHALL